MYFTVHSVAALKSRAGGVSWIIRNAPIKNLERAREIYSGPNWHIELHKTLKR